MKQTKPMKTGGKILAACLAAFQLLTLAVPVSAAGDTAAVPDKAVAGKSNADPGFVYGSKATDYVAGQDYYYLENQYVKTLIGPTKAANDKAGPMSNGAIMDAVTQSAKRENLDWTQFVLDTKMGGTWKTSKTAFDLNELEVKGNTIVGKGASEANPEIQGEVTYSLVEGTPLIQMSVKLTNTGEEDYTGYFEYLVDPDESNEDDTYVPGVGWTTSTIKTVLTDHEWTENYMFEGSSSKYSGKTAHAILWNEAEEVPTGLVNDGYIFGIWYDASLEAGESKTLTFYHLPHQPGSVSAPYAEAAFWAKVIRGEANIDDYGIINGTVTDMNGNPIKNVDITCQYAVGDHAGESAGTTVTDENGNYSLRVEKNVYTLTASIPGYEQSSQSVDLNEQEDPRADMVLDAMAGTRILTTTSMQSFGGLVECKPGDYTLENERITLSVANITKDNQLQDSSMGRILDIAANGRADAVDWLFTSWISDIQPHQDTTEDGIVPGNSWAQLDTRFDKIEVVSQSSSKIVLKATGVYHHDLVNNPDAQEGVVEQVITMESGKPYAEIQTTIRNTSGQELQLYVGDVMDVDEDTQKAYAPGIGDITATSSAPIDEKASQPWFAQYGTGEPEIYAFLYEDNFDFQVFGSNVWAMGYAPVTLAADASFTYNRQIVVLDTEGYEQPAEAMNAYYNAYKYGLEANMDVYDGSVQKGDVFPVTVTIENSAQEPIQNAEVSLTLPYQMFSVGESEITVPEIPAGGSETVEFQVLALEGGRGMLKAEVKAANGIFLNFSQALSISGQGYYAGDNHTHSTHSDGKGTIRENVDSAYEDKLLNWLYSTDHNKISQYNETMTETNRLAGNFISITGTEITSSGKGHALAYGVGTFIPEYRIDKTINGELWTWQDTIDQVNDAGGIFYVAHPNYPGLEFSDPYGIREYTGIEVWNGFYHAIDPDRNVNTFAFDYWDDVNRRGEQKYFGIANSDGHNSAKMGDPYIKTEMDSLTYENIQEILANGSYYGSNGPEIRYNIEGVGMGETLNIKESGKVDFNITAFDPNYDLVNVKLIKNTITGTIDGDSEIVFNKDLEGQGLNEFQTTLALDVKVGEFYRIEVTSEQGTTGNGGKGDGQGLGFAFSNPIWIGSGEKSNATDIKGITYDGGQVLETIGGSTVISVEEAFSADKLSVEVSEGATVSTEVIDAVDDELDTAAAVKITVTAEDGTQDVETVFLTKGEAEEAPSEIVSFATAYVKTEEGTLPQMPETVEATYDDGSTKDVAVDWDDVTAEMVANPGIFKVEGTVAGTAIKAEAFVQVVKVEDAADIRDLLQETYNFALNLSTDGVTDSAKAFFEKALAGAEAALENPDSTQEELATAWDTLLEGIWGLGLYQADKANLGLLIEKAETMIAQADKYVTANWQQLVDALAAAKTVMNNGDAMAEDVSAAAENLLDAMHLQLYKADKAILESLIAKAEGLDLTGYTAESVAVLKTALANANAVYADAVLSVNDQAAVDEAAAALDDALDGLVKLSDGGNTDGDANGDENNTQSPQTGESHTALPVLFLAGLSAALLFGASKRKVKQ